MDTRNTNPLYANANVNQDLPSIESEVRVLNQCNEFTFKQNKDVICPPTHYLNFRCLDDEDNDLIYNEPIGRLSSGDQITAALAASTKARRMRISPDCCTKDRQR